MITFREFICKSIYGGDYYMDNSFKIMLNDTEIGSFHFPNQDNCEVALSEGEMYLEHINLFVKGYSRKVLRSIFRAFSVSRIIAETNDENKSFWEHIGANVDVEYSDEFREMYNLSFSMNDIKNNKEMGK